MSRRHILLSTVGVTLFAALGIVAFLNFPGSPLVGTWVSESPVFDASPGSLRVQVEPDGTGLLLVEDKNWIYEGFQYRVEHGSIVVRLGIPGEVQSKGEMIFSYSVTNDRLSMIAADKETEKMFPAPIHFRGEFAQLKGSR